MATEYGPTIFMDDVSVGSWTKVTGLSHSIVSGGIYTSGAHAFKYQVSGLNDKGRLPLSDVRSVSFTGTATLNAVKLTWDRKDGLTRMVVLKSEDGGVTWKWKRVSTTNAISLTDTGNLSWNETDFESLYSVIPNPNVPWDAPTDLNLESVLCTGNDACCQDIVGVKNLCADYIAAANCICSGGDVCGSNIIGACLCGTLNVSGCGVASADCAAVLCGCFGCNIDACGYDLTNIGNLCATNLYGILDVSGCSVDYSVSAGFASCSGCAQTLDGEAFIRLGEEICFCNACDCGVTISSTCDGILNIYATTTCFCGASVYGMFCGEFGGGSVCVGGSCVLCFWNSCFCTVCMSSTCDGILTINASCVCFPSGMCGCASTAVCADCANALNTCFTANIDACGFCITNFGGFTTGVNTGDEVSIPKTAGGFITAHVRGGIITVD